MIVPSDLTGKALLNLALDILGMKKPTGRQ